MLGKRCLIEVMTYPLRPASGCDPTRKPLITLSILLMGKLRHRTVVEPACKTQSEDGDPLAQHWPGFRERPSMEQGINKAVLLVLLCLADMRGVHGEILEVVARRHRLRAVFGGLQGRCNVLCSFD